MLISFPSFHWPLLLSLLCLEWPKTSPRISYLFMCYKFYSPPYVIWCHSFKTVYLLTVPHICVFSIDSFPESQTQFLLDIATFMCNMLLETNILKSELWSPVSPALYSALHSISSMLIKGHSILLMLRPNKNLGGITHILFLLYPTPNDEQILLALTMCTNEYKALCWRVVPGSRIPIQ